MADVDLYDYKLDYTGSQVEDLLGKAKKSNDILDSMPRVQYGIKKIYVSGANTSASGTIEFNYKFSDPPRVVIMPVASGKVKTSLSNESCAGFNITISSSKDIKSADIYWIAISQ